VKSIKIINGLVPDFEKMLMIQKDILLEEGKISQIGSISKEADIIIDAKGKIVSPGFIDIHMHEEELDMAEKDPYFIAYYELMMGVTTCVGGNCGANRQSVEEFTGYIQKNGSPVNYLMYLGHNFLRSAVGIEDRYRASTKNEIEQMKHLVRKYVPTGIVGISYGIEYSPGIETEEIVDLAGVLDSDKYLLSAHFRSDVEKSVEAITELIQISKMSKLPMQISHIGSCSAYGYMDQGLKTIIKARMDGADVFADCYPYDAFGTFIGSAAFDDGCFEKWNRTYSDVLLTEEPFKNVRCTEEIFFKARTEYPDMIAVAFVMNESEIIQALQAPFVFVGSDGVYRKDSGHPRGAGSFPKVLSRYVRENKNLDMVDALRKMTLGPANRIRLYQKGEIKTGMDADITIFDPETIKDKSTFEQPTLPPEGITHVIINGEIAVENNQIKNGRLGKFVRYNLE
jgi:N-acyl-D-amino-acid deacylase